MGLGDWLLGAGLAREPASRGKRVAFGDGKRVLHDGNAEQILRYSPHIVWPGQPLNSRDIEWVHFFKGCRRYSTQDGDRWAFNYDFRAIPGQFFFSQDDIRAAGRMNLPREFIVIEPNSKHHLPIRAAYLVNKKWPFSRYQAVTDALIDEGWRVVQFAYGTAPRLSGAWLIQTPNFRSAAAILARAKLYIGSEGGLHHAAAALNVPAAVLFGGWLPPQVLGYDTHINLTGGETDFCGLLRPCAHCAAAMNRIGVDDVIDAAHTLLKG